MHKSKLALLFMLLMCVPTQADTPERQQLLSASDGKEDASGVLQAAIDAGRGC